MALEEVYLLSCLLSPGNDSYRIARIVAISLLVLLHFKTKAREFWNSRANTEDQGSEPSFTLTFWYAKNLVNDLLIASFLLSPVQSKTWCLKKFRLEA